MAAGRCAPPPITTGHRCKLRLPICILGVAYLYKLNDKLLAVYWSSGGCGGDGNRGWLAESHGQRQRAGRLRHATEPGQGRHSLGSDLCVCGAYVLALLHIHDTCPHPNTHGPPRIEHVLTHRCGLVRVDVCGGWQLEVIVVPRRNLEEINRLLDAAVCRGIGPGVR